MLNVKNGNAVTGSTGAELPLEELEQMAAGVDNALEYLEILFANESSSAAFAMLRDDVKNGRASLKIADAVVGKIEAHYQK